MASEYDRIIRALEDISGAQNKYIRDHGKPSKRFDIQIESLRKRRDRIQASKKSKKTRKKLSRKA